MRGYHPLVSYEVVSALSWNVLGTFEDEAAAQAAVVSSIDDGNATPHDLVVYVSNDDGSPANELADGELAAWAGLAQAV